MTPPRPLQIAARPRYPLTAVAHVLYTDRDGALYSCSGSVIGSRSRTVLTAAHCEWSGWGAYWRE